MGCGWGEEFEEFEDVGCRTQPQVSVVVGVGWGLCGGSRVAFGRSHTFNSEHQLLKMALAVAGFQCIDSRFKDFFVIVAHNEY